MSSQIILNFLRYYFKEREPFVSVINLSFKCDSFLALIDKSYSSSEDHTLKVVYAPIIMLRSNQVVRRPSSLIHKVYCGFTTSLPLSSLIFFRRFVITQEMIWPKQRLQAKGRIWECHNKKFVLLILIEINLEDWWNDWMVRVGSFWVEEAMIWYI